MTIYPPHPAATIFSMMEGAEWNEYNRRVTSAKRITTPIVLCEHDGVLKVLDGRNRQRVAELNGWICPTRMATAEEAANPLEFVMQANADRRQLTPAAKAMAAAEYAKLLAPAAKERQREGNAKGGKSRRRLIGDAGLESSLDLDSTPGPKTPHDAVAEAARTAGVSRATVFAAKAVERDGAPELVAALKDGAVSVDAAKEIAALPADEQAAVVALPDTERKAVVRALRGAPKKSADKKQIFDLALHLDGFRKDVSEMGERWRRKKRSDRAPFLRELEDVCVQIARLRDVVIDIGRKVESADTPQAAE